MDQGSRTYNLGNGRGFSVREVIETARKVTGHSIPAEVRPRRPRDPAVLIAGSDRIRRELGWEPRHPELRNIIESAWPWRRKHPGGFGHRRGPPSAAWRAVADEATVPPLLDTGAGARE